MKLTAREIAEALRCDQDGCDCGRAAGAEWKTHCPAHHDTHPSLSLVDTEDRKVLVKCFTGCDQESVVAALQELGLWPRGRFTVKELAAAKMLDPEFLGELGVVDAGSKVKIPYFNLDGEEVAVRSRLSLNGDRRFKWRSGDRVIPYGLWRLRHRDDTILLVEGESDAWTCWTAGIPALGIPGSSTWKQAWGEHLSGKAYVWHEPDGGGNVLLKHVTKSLPEVRVVVDAECKDPSEIWISLAANKEAFRERMRRLMEAARPASELREEEESAAAAEALAAAGDLPVRPDLLDLHAKAIREVGYVGDVRPALLVKVAAVSRVLERPLNLALVSPSASGKNAAINAGLALVPPEAYHEMKASSPRALIYSDDSFEHKMIVLAEADSIADDGSAASAIRSIVEDGALSYETVEKGESGRHEVRRIEKKGPTGIVTTSTGTLADQMWTRCLEVSISDSPDQTRLVLRAHAAGVNEPRSDIGTDPFVALDRWVEIGGEHRVAVPFAARLAELVPTNLVRMRRDFKQCLTVIQAVTLLHQRQRLRDEEGRIVAEREDYRHARDLLLDVFAAVASGGITEAVRETVEVIRRLYDGSDPLTVKRVGDELGLSRDTAWYRVRRAIDLGFVANEESQKGKPAKLAPGDPLPAERPALPTVEEVFPEGEPELPVESRLKTGLSTAEKASPDTKTPPNGVVVERLNSISGGSSARVLKFMEEHVVPVLKGAKTQTSRTSRGAGDAKLVVGSYATAMRGGEPFAELEIVDVERRRLGDFDKDDAQREGGYTLKEFKRVWRRLHPRRGWSNGDRVWVIRFRVTGEGGRFSTPEMDSTVQPLPETPICPLSGPAVESAVESGVVVESVAETDSTVGYTYHHGSVEAVRMFNLAQTRGWPSMSLGEREIDGDTVKVAVAGNRLAWEQAAQRFPVELAAEMVIRLESMLT